MLINRERVSWTREQTQVEDVLAEIERKKWSWAGHGNAGLQQANHQRDSVATGQLNEMQRKTDNLVKGYRRYKNWGWIKVVKSPSERLSHCSEQQLGSVKTW